ncbi:hypothetical protein [Streptococcus pneumoniae]|uniref:hypothetical protein n=1 Tax=Streptococcus pneumoniae TaxID=1313 RepID=UPI0005DA83A4|nr:hypothetical protein [Streptococcus pneumoniae]CMX52659.1 chlorohydrolase [Streptococcus pneumoniae]
MDRTEEVSSKHGFEVVLASGCSKHCFKVVDGTDEVSSKHGFEVVDETDEVSSQCFEVVDRTEEVSSKHGFEVVDRTPYLRQGDVDVI